MQESEFIYLAGGCFWGVQDLLRELEGVLETEVGYTGGHTTNPTYEEICTGETGHAEAIKVVFDPSKTTPAAIFEFFFKMHDPTTINQQGNDRGPQYRSAIFYCNEKQKTEAIAAIERASDEGLWKNPIVTEVLPAKEFYTAEHYHQDYLRKNPGGYTCHFVRSHK